MSLFVTTFALDGSTKPLIGGTSGFASIFTINYGAQATVAVVVMAPLVLLFQRRIFSGLTVGAVVG